MDRALEELVSGGAYTEHLLPFQVVLAQLDPLVQRQSAAWYPIGYGVGQGERPLPNSLCTGRGVSQDTCPRPLHR